MVTPTRMVYLSPRPNLHRMAQCIGGLYYLLDREVSGVVLRQDGDWLEIKPDGWPLPPGVWPEGFGAPNNYFRAATDGEVKTGKLVDGLGMEIAATAAREMVRQFLQTAPGGAFESTTREDALEWMAQHEPT